MSYNIAVGLDNSTLNKLIANIYQQVYPSIFKTNIKVASVGIATVDIDINDAPKVNLTALPVGSKDLQETLEKQLPPEYHLLNDAEKNNLFEMANAATFTLSIPSINITINYSDSAQPTIVYASLNAPVNIQAQTLEQTNYLIAKIVTATFSVASNPVIEQILNNALAPFFIPYLNDKLLSPIKIPALHYKSLSVSLPVPVVQQPFVLAYAALGLVQPSIPAPASWPSETIFAGVDDTLLQAAAAIPFPIGPSDSFDWHVISGNVEAQIHAPSQILINDDGSLSTTIKADASAQLTWHTPGWLPNISFGPDAQASLSVTFKPSVVNGTLNITIERPPIPTFSFDWGIPSWINWLFSPIEDGLADALNEVLGRLINKAFEFPPIPIFSLPTVSFNLAEKKITINIDQATTEKQNSLLVVSAQPIIKIHSVSIDVKRHDLKKAGQASGEFTYNTTIIWDAHEAVNVELGNQIFGSKGEASYSWASHDFGPDSGQIPPMTIKAIFSDGNTIEQDLPFENYNLAN